MKLTFLEAKVPLTKTFRLAEDGTIDKDGHPKIVDYLSHHYDVPKDDLQQLFEKVRYHASLNHCWQKGNATEKLDWTSRAGKTDPNEATHVLLLDLDGVKGLEDIPSFLRSLRLGAPDYIVQYSSSMGVLPGKGLSAHVFVLLDRPYMPTELKEWLRYQNFAVHELRDGIRLSKNGNAPRWTLDVTTCQSDKLIYIAPPVCEEGVVDTFAELGLGGRIQVVRQQTRTARLDQSGYTPESNSLRVQAKMDELRKAAGLEAKPWNKTKEERGELYMPNPDVSVVTGVKEHGEYVSLNLNGGDSWGYWHWANDPYFLYNWKGEPVFRLKDIVPDYWANLRRSHKREVSTGGVEYLVFRDIKRSRYYNGTYDRAADVLDIYEADGEGQLFSYMKEYGQTPPDVIPTWKVDYNPKDPVRVDPQRKWLNLYQPSDFERRWLKEQREVKAVPDLARKFIWHAVGQSEECYERLLNWLAVMVQVKERTQTAWLLHGVQGTGKGYIFNELLRPALGSSAMVTNLENFEGQFNAFLENKILICVDEAEMAASAVARILEGKLRQLITEPIIPIRAMRKTMYEINSYLNFIIFANKGAGINVVDHDRRYNIAPYQDVRIETFDAEYKAAAAQAWDFFCYIRTRSADVELAKTALMNEAKAKVTAATRNSLDEVAKNLLEGNYEYFWENIRDDVKSLTKLEQDLWVEYKRIVEAMREWRVLHRDEVSIMFKALVGREVPDGSEKFGKFLAHHRITVVGGLTRPDRPKTFRGIRVNWRKS